jgi:hypothetical protein
MSKSGGLGWTSFKVDNDVPTAIELRNDFTNLEIATPYNTQDITGIDKWATERLALLADLSGTLNSVFNPAANQVHAVMSGDMRLVRTISLEILLQKLTAKVLFTDYALTRAAGGEFTGQHPFVLADGTVPDWTV